MTPIYKGPEGDLEDARDMAAESRGMEDYDVQGLWILRETQGPGSDITEETIGSVTLLEGASWQDMPSELEINGFTYRLEV